MVVVFVTITLDAALFDEVKVVNKYKHRCGSTKILPGGMRNE
jgi:hypothetical protein